jgi:hypothetical protein
MVEYAVHVTCEAQKINAYRVLVGKTKETYRLGDVAQNFAVCNVLVFSLSIMRAEEEVTFPTEFQSCRFSWVFLIHPVHILLFARGVGVEERAL